MNSFVGNALRAGRHLGLAWGLVLLAGCAGQQAFREGNALLADGKFEQGLGKLEEAVRLDPRNIEYRLAFSGRKTLAVQRLLLAADGALRAGELPQAEDTYRQVQVLEPGQAMARQGLEAVAAERRHRQALAESQALLQTSDVDGALAKLHGVLTENPRHKEAADLKMRADEMRGKAREPVQRLAKAYQKPITLEFRDAPLRSVFDAVAQVSGLNFFFDKEVRQDLRVTVLARNVAIEEAMRLLLTTNQLEQKVLNDNSVLVYPATAQKLREHQSLSIRTFYLVNADVKAVANTIKTLVKTRDMVVDERLGLIILRDTPQAIRLAEKLVALQDLSDPEAMLEVEILEIKRSRLLELGIRWPDQLALSPVQATGVPLTLDRLRQLSSSQIQASIGNVVLNARKEDQDGNILANPRIRVRNREKAQVLIGEKVPVITTTSTATGFVAESVNYVDVGLKLEVEPTVFLDEEVAIKIKLEVSNLVREVVSKNGSLSYQIGTRSASTVLRLKDGETQVLAGLINDEDRSTANKVPGLGELPVLGRVFGSQKDDTQRSEILLSITPRVLRSIRRADLSAAEFDSGPEGAFGGNVAPPAAGVAPSPSR